MMRNEDILAKRLGMTIHISPLRFRLQDVYTGSRGSTTASCLEDWLVDVANVRGATVVRRPGGPPREWVPPVEEVLSNEELVVAICQVQGLDRPQILRLAAQLISCQAVSPDTLLGLAERERVRPILAELARQALRVDRTHPLWQLLARRLGDEKPLRDSLLHWTRLAEPVMKDGRCNAQSWRLVT
jgi:hypothetical protein